LAVVATPLAAQTPQRTWPALFTDAPAGTARKGAAALPSCLTPAMSAAYDEHTLIAEVRMARHSLQNMLR
jgi:hypothetical protein